MRAGGGAQSRPVYEVWYGALLEKACLQVTDMPEDQYSKCRATTAFNEYLSGAGVGGSVNIFFNPVGGLRII